MKIESKLLYASLVFSFVVLIGILAPSYAQTPGKFGYEIHPNKLLENTEGSLQIYSISGDTMLPKKIDGLKITSSNNKIVTIGQITENKNEFIKNVEIIAKEPGEAKIALAAPDFSSIEIPVTVFTNNNFPTQILMKITPNDFPVDGPQNGFITVELATTDGFPVVAQEDAVVSISTPNTNTIGIEDKDLIIKKGDYYAIGKFQVKNSGDAVVFADSPNMKRVSELVHVRKAADPLTVKLFAFPSTVNSLKNSQGFVIAQLQDDEGIPLKAKKDIKIAIKVTNPDATLNVSRDFEELLFSKDKITIEEGSYWGFTSFTPRPDLEKYTTTPTNSYSISLSTDDYIVEGTQVSIVHKEALVGEGPAILETVPILTTGQRELIGILHLSSSLPVMASKDLDIQIDSSHTSTVKIGKVQIKQGKNAAPVFAQTGAIIPDAEDSLSLYVTDVSGTATVPAESYGPEEDNLQLVVEPLVPKILAENNFPIISYLLETAEDDESTSGDEDEEEDGRLGVTHFVRDTVITFSANEFIDVEPKVIKQGQDYGLIEAFASKVGNTNLEVRGSDLESSSSIEVLSTDPAQLQVSYPQTVLPQTINEATIQVLDFSGNPVYSKNDIEIKLVSDNDRISVPEIVKIKQGDYNTSFEFKAQKEGTSQLSVLSEDLPLSKFPIKINGISPALTLDISKYVQIDETFDVGLNVDFPSFDLPVDNVAVDWTVEGGIIQKSDSATNKDGIAKITISPKDVEEIIVNAKVSGIGFSEEIKEGTALVVKPKPEPEEISKPEPEPEPSFFESNNILLITLGSVIGGIIGFVVFLKKTDRLDSLSEKMNFGDKFSGIKDKASSLKER